MKNLLYVQFSNPAAYPPVQHSARLLARDGWRVLVLGVESPGTEELEWSHLEGVEFRLMRGTPRGLALKLQYLAFVAWSVYWCIRWRASLIYASDPTATPVVRVLQTLLGRAVVYHEHDSPAADATANPHDLVTRSRNAVAHGARLCILPNYERAEALVASTGASRERVMCVWNCPSIEEVRDTFPNKTGFGLYFHGSINEIRLPTAVLDAMVQLPSHVRLDFAGYETLGSVGYVEHFLAHARRLGLDAARIRFLGTAGSRSAVMEWASHCDAGLAFMPLESNDINMRNMVGASNKPFDYMASGLALVVSRLPDWERAFVEPGYAVSCDPGDGSSIANAIMPLLDPAIRDAMRRASTARIRADWNYQHQYLPVLNLVKQIGEAQ